ncbi:fibronectin type III domain-containing protein, partial [Candidatus Uhrbacteria bacterium]|nr:fibronectin type III domain-containing protein [Candidatus Uhrbacteria bacterium]
VFTKDATQSAYYLDGSLTHSSTQTDPAVITTEDIVVGGTAMDTDVDDLRMYNRALSATEARELGGFPAPDTQAPGPPTSMSIVEVTSTRLEFHWTAPSDNVGVTRYDVRYKTGQTSFTETEWLSAKVDPYSPPPVAGGVGMRQIEILPDLTPSTEYVVGVKACDGTGNCSAIASLAFRTSSVGTTGGQTGGDADTQAPNIPANVVAEDITTSSARIAWIEPQDNVMVSSYEVRYRSGTSFANIDWTNATATPPVPSTVGPGDRVSTVLSALAASTDYAVGVKACDSSNNCSMIAAVTFRTGASGTTGTTTTSTNTGTISTSSGGGGGVTTTTTTTTTGTAALRVIVRDQNNQSVSGAFVGLSFPAGGVAVPSTTTGTDGMTLFQNVAAGNYHLGVSPPANRADLGSVANYPVALAIGSTTEVSTALPVRTATSTTTGVTPTTTANAAQLCGTTYDSDRNILSGITVGLSQSGGGTAQLGMSVTTGGDGRFCFMNLAPGTYVVGAATPAHRTDLAPPGTVVISLAAGTTGSQDIMFGRASFVATPGVAPIVVPTTAPPLSAIERCVREAFGSDLYERMRTGRLKPKAEEYARAKHCFNLTVISDTGPVTPPIGAPAVPTGVPSVIVLQGPIVPVTAVRVPDFDDRCEARELPRVKRGVQQLSREFDRIDRELTRLRTAKVVVPTETGLLLSRARDLLAQVRAATTCEDAFTAGEELPDLMQQLRTSIERVGRLRFAPRVLTSFDRAVKRFLDRTQVEIRRLERAKFDVAEFRTRRGEASAQLKECRASASAALQAIDPELFEDTMRSCFEILDEVRELQELTSALANARAYLTGAVAQTLRKADRIARQLEREQEDASEVRQFADALRKQRDDALATVRRAGVAKDEIVDALEGVITVLGDLDDAFEHALGTTTYDTIVGKPSAAIATPKLEKQAVEFFERE